MEVGNFDVSLGTTETPGVRSRGPVILTQTLRGTVASPRVKHCVVRLQGPWVLRSATT